MKEATAASGLIVNKGAVRARQLEHSANYCHPNIRAGGAQKRENAGRKACSAP
jgi:hypothetical protein